MTGTWSLVRLALRLDRVRLPVWLLVLVGLPLATASSFAELYPGVPERMKLAAEMSNNPTLLGLYGRIYDATTLGGLVSWRMGGFLPVLIGLMSLLLVIRHTRAEEQAGRLELVGSGVVGRRAPLTAALVLALLVNLVLALLIALGMIGQGEDATGAFALGLSFAGAGLVFASVAAVTAQVTENSRTASGLAVVVLGAAYLLRAFGDGASAGENGPSWLSWLSPLGWVQLVRPYGNERWWVLGLMASVCLLLVALAYALVARRDYASGLVPPRLGPAASAMGSPVALAWRLQRGSLLAWSAGLAALGLALGTAAEGVGDLVRDNQGMADVFERIGGAQGQIDQFLAGALGIVGLIAAAYTVQAALRLRVEETTARAEPVLATPVTRLRWAASHLLFAFLGTVVVLGALGLAAGLAHGLRTGDLGGELPRVLAGALVVVPAAWVVAGLCVALFGLAPRLAAVAWGAVVLFLILTYFGAVLQLNQWVMDLSPYTHLPKLPGTPFTATPLLWLVALAAALTVAGLAGFRRRGIG
ncbi:MAG TPA: ABC transporter permease [Micromonosporaceae bacterium]|nr:ABC transporter permease [Micromonosporaceae bacterium]